MILMKHIILDLGKGLYIIVNLYIGTYTVLDLYIPWYFLLFSGLYKQNIY